MFVGNWVHNQVLDDEWLAVVARCEQAALEQTATQPALEAAIARELGRERKLARDRGSCLEGPTGLGPRAPAGPSDDAVLVSPTGVRFNHEGFTKPAARLGLRIEYRLRRSFGFQGTPLRLVVRVRTGERGPGTERRP